MALNIAGAGPIGLDIIHRDQECLSPSYAREYALVVDRAEGSELWDMDGKRYLDFMAGVAVLNVGHRHPKVVEAVKKQLDKFWHICLADFYYPQAVELAEKLQTTAPMWGDTKVFFGNSGTEAVEAAVKLAQYKTGRNYFIGCLGAFHGRTLGSLSFTASRYVQRGKYLTALPVFHIPYPNPYRDVVARGDDDHSVGDAVLRYMEDILFVRLVDPYDIAGILIEPIQGEGGYVVPPKGFFPRLRELCDQYGIMMMVDEVQSGVGRTGKWWAIEHEEIEPDIVCFAKGVGSGMPIGGIITRTDDMIWRSGSHASTFGGNPVAAAAALATLQVIEEENLMAQATETGHYIRAQLKALQEKHDGIGDVRGRGLMVGIEFVKDRETRERAIELRNFIIQWAFEQGLLLIPCGENSIRMTPPLNISRTFVDEGLQIFAQAVAEGEKHLL